MKNDFTKDEILDSEEFNIERQLKNYRVEQTEVNSSTVCAMLKISRQTLSNWVKAGKISRTTSGKYNLEEIRKLL